MSILDIPILYYIEQKRLSEKDEYLPQIFQSINDERILSYKQGIYFFNYVGIISLPFCIISVLPKYTSADLSTSELEEATRYNVQILQQYSNVSQKYDGLDFLASKPDDIYYSEPVLADNLINYYVRYGIYEKEEKVYTNSGPGIVNWQLTVEQTAPLITGKSIFYPETIGSIKRAQSDENISLLHLWATKYCIEKYGKLLPGYDGIEFIGNAPDDLDEIGSLDFLIGMLYKELRFVFADLKINLLNNLIWLLEQKKSSNQNDGISFYGSSSFHFIWEDACKRCFNDQSDNPQIKDLFVAPEWISKSHNTFNINKGSAIINKRNLLIPDVVWFDSQIKSLVILDAKYYDIKFKGTQILDNPGIADISKQIIYQQILTKSKNSPFTDETQVFNGFIFPFNPAGHERSNDWIWGHVNSKIAGWEDYQIQVLIVPHREIFDRYVNSRPLPDIKGKLGMIPQLN